MKALYAQVRNMGLWLSQIQFASGQWTNWTRKKKTLLSYTVACVLPLMALVVEHWLEPLTGHTSYQLFLGVVALSAIFGGVGNGLCTLALSALLKYYFFLAQHTTGNGAAVLRLVLFTGLGLVVVWLAGTLRSTQRRLQSTLKFIGDAVVLTNSQKRIVFMNAVAEILTGWANKEAKGKNFSEVISLFDEENMSPVDDPIEKAFNEGTAISLDRPLFLPSITGGASAVEGSVAPIRDSTGKVTGSVTVLRDVSEQLALEAELRTSQKIQALSRLTGPLAHDFNNWLTIIGGHAELLRGKLADTDDPALTESAEAVVRATDEAGRLARQLLSFNNEPAAQRGKVDINRLLDRMEAAIKAILGDYISVITALEKEVWPVKAAPEQLEQVIINLVANARDAMPRGGILKIRTCNISLVEDGELRSYVMLEIRDDGIGMDDNTKSRIFEPFFTTKLHQEGAGLGLSLVYSIIVQYGGGIKVLSAPDRGSTFQVYLPRFDEEQEIVSSDHLPAVNRVRLTFSPVVLVVESNDGVRKLIVSTLRAENYSVLEAANGRQALEVALQHINHLDLIVTELTAHAVTGPELATRLSLLRPDIKVVYISSYPKPASWDKNGSEPNRAFLFKPFSPGELLAQVDFLLSVKSLRE